MFDDIVTLSRHFLEINHKAYERYFLGTHALKQRCMVIIGKRGIGKRGIGKTTTLIQYLLQHAKGDALNKKILYVQTDHFLVANHSLYEIAEMFQALGGEVIAFDEIHKYPDWSKELKSIYDTLPNLKVIASGSSALEIHKGSHDLSRRAIVYRMHGLSLREYLGLKYDLMLPTFSLKEIIDGHESIADNLIKQLKKRKIRQVFNDYLNEGYYPYFLEIGDVKAYLITLEQNVHVTLESDLLAIYPQLTGSTIKKIKQLLTYVAASVPFAPDWKKIKSMIGVSDDRTLKTYFKYLEGAELIKIMRAFSGNMQKTLSKEKIYLDNPNQIQALTVGESESGTLREVFFINMLQLKHEVSIPAQGNFMVDGQWTFEVGGRNKNNNQIKGLNHAYIACDGIERGIKNKIPLWLLGFLY